MTSVYQWPVTGLLVVAVLFGAQGCAAQQDVNAVSSLTVEEAKSEAQSTEDAIAALIPAHSATRVAQHPTGGLLSCKGESVYQWYGHTYVDLRPGVDGEAILDDVIDTWKDHRSFSVSTHTNLSNTRVVELDGQYKSTYFVNVAEEGSQISITSFSSCFILPKGANPGGQY